MSVISVMVQSTQHCFLLKYLQTSPIFYFNEISSNYWIDFKNHPEAHKSFHCQKLCQIFELQFAPNGSQLELEKCCKHILLGGDKSEKPLPAQTMSLRGIEDLSGCTVTTGIIRIPTPWWKLLLQVFCTSQTYPGNCSLVWFSCPLWMAKHMESSPLSLHMCMTSMSCNHEAKGNKSNPFEDFWELHSYWMGSNKV